MSTTIVEWKIKILILTKQLTFFMYNKSKNILYQNWIVN